MAALKIKRAVASAAVVVMDSESLPDSATRMEMQASAEIQDLVENQAQGETLVLVVTQADSVAVEAPALEVVVAPVSVVAKEGFHN